MDTQTKCRSQKKKSIIYQMKNDILVQHVLPHRGIYVFFNKEMEDTLYKCMNAEGECAVYWTRLVCS